MKSQTHEALTSVTVALLTVAALSIFGCVTPTEGQTARFSGLDHGRALMAKNEIKLGASSAADVRAIAGPPQTVAKIRVVVANNTCYAVEAWEFQYRDKVRSFTENNLSDYTMTPPQHGAFTVLFNHDGVACAVADQPISAYR